MKPATCEMSVPRFRIAAKAIPRPRGQRSLPISGLLLLLMLLPISPVAGQSATHEIVSDPAGDTRLLEASPSGDFPAADLRSLNYEAREGTMWLTLGVSNLGDASRPELDSVVYLVDMDYGGAMYRIRVERIVPVPVFTSEPEYAVELYRQDPELDLLRLVTALNFTVDAASLTMELPLFELRTGSGLPAIPGAQIENVAVTATDIWGDDVYDADEDFGVGVQPPKGPAPIYDRMPDTGFAGFVLDMPNPVGQRVFFESPDPIRASNGGMGTYVFPLRLVNFDDQAQDRILRVAGLPDGWNHAFVASTIHMKPGDDVLTQLVVEVTGAHAHGGATNFTVQANDVDGNPAGEAQLQIVYTDIPQPAGHHPTLYFHVLAPADGLVPLGQAETMAANLHRNRIIMNTLEEDPLDSGLPATDSSYESGRQWRVPLSPDLGLGLDFDLQRLGTVHVKVASSSSQVGLPQFSVAGTLLLRTKAGDVVLADVKPSEPLDLLAETELDLELVPTSEAELIPYSPDQDLELVLDARYALDPAQQRLGYMRANLLDGWMTLPLIEYQDLIPLGTDLDIVATVTPEQQYGNPGDVLRFNVDVTNAGPRTLDLGVSFLTTTVAAESTTSRLQVGVGESKPLTVYVTVPHNATDGEQVTAFLRLADGQVATLVGATVIVTTSEEIPSADLPGEGRDAPSIGPWLLAVGLVGLAFVRRRQG